MALDPLVTTGALLARTPDLTGNLTVALAAASAAVRDAARSTISQVASTVVVPAPTGSLLRLPGPVVSIDSIEVDGTVVTGWQTMPEGAWSLHGWGAVAYAPVTVTYTHGLAEVPEDIVDLVCSLAAEWLRHQANGGGSVAGLESVKIDDAAESYTSEASGHVSPLFIPQIQRDELAARFGGGATVVEYAL